MKLYKIYEETKKWEAENIFPFLPDVLSYDEKRINFEKYGNCLSFGSCDYFGFSQCPELIENAIAAVRKYGANTQGAQVFCGYTSIHKKVERILSEQFNRDSFEAILFPSGFHANIGTISTLYGPDDLIIADRFSHVSIIYGALLSRANIEYFDHNDYESLENILKSKRDYARTLIVTEGIFSAEGDRGILTEITELAERYNACVMVDEAHSFGVFGRTGYGITEELNLLSKIDFYVATFSKALGSTGGFLIADIENIRQLRLMCPSYTSSRGVSPGVAAASEAGLEKLYREGNTQRGKITQNFKLLKQLLSQYKFEYTNGDTQVFGVIVGRNSKTVRVANWLMNNGIYVSPMLTPTVPLGRSRLRILVSSHHSGQDLALLMEKLREAREIYAF